MSLETVKNEIGRFLASDTPEVLAIKGAWGVGKTFAWNTLLKEAQQHKKIKLTKYSYVSLFGINSLDSFKFSIFQQQIGTDSIGTEPNLLTFNKNTINALSSLGKKCFPLFQGLPYVKTVAPAIESVAFFSISQTLICVDDFERKGNSLSPKDILGLISSLKERKRCKVVLILNDNSFGDEKLKEEYDTYREKVVDIELLFDPSPNESISIALDVTTPYHLILKGFIVLLKINNIRLINKIERLAALLTDVLAPYESEVLNQALHSLVLFSWCSYIKDEKSPNIDFIKSLGHKNHSDFEKRFPDNTIQWHTTLRAYGYGQSSELDLAVAKIVEMGYICKQALIIEAEKLNRQIIAEKSGYSFEDAWHLYHDSFDNNEEEVIQGIYDSFKRNAKFISLLNLNTTVKLFKDLGREAQANELINHYIDTRREEKQLFDLDNYTFVRDIDDPLILKEFAKINNETNKFETIEDAMDALSRGNDRASFAVEFLANTSVDNYYTFIKNTSGRQLSKRVHTLLAFRCFANGCETDLGIPLKTKEALLQIAKESQINARRVASYGIKVDETAAEEQ